MENRLEYILEVLPQVTRKKKIPPSLIFSFDIQLHMIYLQRGSSTFFL